SSYRNLLAQAAKTMLSELNTESVHRLEGFLDLTQQAIRNKEQNRTAAHGPEQLLALAVSGWLLGNGVAGPDVDIAVRLWKARHFILEHQRTHNAGDRQTLLAAYQKGEGVPFDELAQVIRSMPPPEPMEDFLLKNGPWLGGALPFAPAPVFWAISTVQRLLPVRLELQADLPWAARRGPTYALQLPPEYHHGRAYPILFVL